MADEALVFVRRGEDLLVVWRAPEGGDYRHVIGGAVEPGETDEGAATRALPATVCAA